MLDGSEEDLIRAARAGDGVAFAELIRPSYKPAFRIAYGMLQNHDEAEDAIQQASLKAWRRLGNLREGTSVGPWFLGIVNSQCRTPRLVGRSSAPLDPVTDFPGEPRGGAYEHLRKDLESRHIKSRRTPFRFNPPEPSLRLLAAALIVPVVGMSFVLGSVAYYGITHGLIPAHTPHFSGTCSRGFQMVDATHGWNGYDAKTDDGGKTWSRLGLPGGGYIAGECIFGPRNAWVVSPIQISPTEVSAYVFATNDRGAIWTQAGSVPLADPNSSISLEFIDSSRGWMLTETSPDLPGAPRAFYTTVDGGRNWTAVAEAGSTLQQESGACLAAGITFINSTTGWISFDCGDRGYGQRATGNQGPTVILTTDGGRHWQAAALPGLPSGDSEKCSAGAAIFTQAVGVMPVFCNGSNLWSGVYRTGDGGRYWTAGLLPSPVHNSDIDFVDATTGFAYDQSNHVIYRTTDSGGTWSTVAENAFTGPTVGAIEFDFIDARTGFAYIDYYVPSVWKTVDGGKTWKTVTTSDARPEGICPAYEKPTTPELVTMFGPTSAWALGGLRTVDGGEHWTMAGPPSVPNRALGSSEFYLDANHAWVAETAFQTGGCGDTVYVFSTADGGLTWRQATPIHAPLPAGSAIWDFDTAASVDSPAWNEPQWMDFIDPMHGWLMLTFDRGAGPQGQPDGPIYRTTDGGATWSVMSNGVSGDFNCAPTPNLRFASPTTGWVGQQPCDNGTALYVTHDAGATWQNQVLPLSCQCWSGTPVFFDRDHGFIPVSDGQDMIMLFTLDGGQSWVSKPLRGNSVDSVYFIDVNHGWLNGLSDGLRNLEYSRDAGDTWEVMALPPTPLYARVTYRFADPTNGLLSLGDSLYRTVDSGWHWTKVNYEIVG